MKTFEGRMFIKWFKNDNGDIRPLTIDCIDNKTLIAELDAIKRKFQTEGDDPLYKFYHPKRLAYSVKFELTERR